MGYFIDYSVLLLLSITLAAVHMVFRKGIGEVISSTKAVQPDSLKCNERSDYLSPRNVSDLMTSMDAHIYSN